MPRMSERLVVFFDPASLTFAISAYQSDMLYKLRAL